MSLLSEIEKTYGKYLFVPFDIPKILPNDLDKFVDFYFTHARPMEKQRQDLLKITTDVKTSWNTIDSSSDEPIGFKSIWSENKVASIYTEFPEIFEQVHEYMPFIDQPTFKWMMWSSHRDVIEHREWGLTYDFPIVIRSKLYDTNPYETIELRLTKPDESSDLHSIPKLDDTNTFAWNNLRTTHRSKYIDGSRKILFIFSALSIRRIVNGGGLNSYITMLDRSISKYQDKIIIDNETTAEDHAHARTFA